MKQVSTQDWRDVLEQTQLNLELVDAGLAAHKVHLAHRLAAELRAAGELARIGASVRAQLHQRNAEELLDQFEDGELEIIRAVLQIR